MDKKSPLYIDRDNYILKMPFSMKQASISGIIAGIIGIPIFLYFFDTKYIISNGEAFALVLALLFTPIFWFGSKRRLVFNTATKDIFYEGTYCFIPYSKKICKFNDIIVLGIKGIKNHFQKKDYYTYHLVYVTNQKPEKFEEMVHAGDDGLIFDDLNKIGEVLGQIMERKFIKGEHERSIRVYEEDGLLTYGNQECEVMNLD
jgi:hypothetical protein